MDKIVICTSVGVYTKALTRGKEYKEIAEDEEKDQLKIIGDNNRARWFRQGYFAPHGTTASPCYQNGSSMMSFMIQVRNHYNMLR